MRNKNELRYLNFRKSDIHLFEILDYMNLEQFTKFNIELLNGKNYTQIDFENVEDFIKFAKDNMHLRIESIFNDKFEFENIMTIYVKH